MAIYLIAFWLLGYAFYLFYTTLIHGLFFSPLRKIPTAHWSCSISYLWIRYHRYGGYDALPTITAAHARKGRIIRLAPDEISVSTLEGAKQVYVEKGGFAKPKWWADMFTTFGVINMNAMQGGEGSKEHAKRKRDLGNVYAKRFIMGNLEWKETAKVILGSTQDVIEGLVRENEGVLDVFLLNGAMSADFTSAYQFGLAGRSHLMESPAARNTYYNNHDSFIEGSKIVKAKALAWLEDFCMHQYRSAESAQSNNEKTVGDAIVYNQLKSRGIIGKDLASETLDHLLAGAEGAKNILTYLQWELSKQPAIQSAVRKELLQLDASDLTSSFMALDSLPLLDAVLSETLRVYASFPGPQPRITPPGGTTIHGFYIPGGIHIHTSFKFLNYNPNVFPEPSSWKPERWLSDDQTKVEEMRRCLWTFNKGSRICIGKDFIVLGTLT
jgi:hypothetical protein